MDPTLHPFEASKMLWSSSCVAEKHDAGAAGWRSDVANDGEYRMAGRHAVRLSGADVLGRDVQQARWESNFAITCSCFLIGTSVGESLGSFP